MSGHDWKRDSLPGQGALQSVPWPLRQVCNKQALAFT